MEAQQGELLEGPNPQDVKATTQLTLEIQAGLYSGSNPEETQLCWLIS